MPPVCTYTYLDGNVHQYVFSQSTRSAVDEWLAIADQLLIQYPTAPGQIARVLFDTCQSGPLPLFYAFQRSAEWNRRHASVYRPLMQKTAYLYPDRDQSYNAIMSQLSKVFAPAYFVPKYFGEDRAAAIAWLLTDHR
jgi:hypothetical protein